MNRQETISIEQLRARVRQIEIASVKQQDVLAFGVTALDGALPQGGLSYGAIHEVGGGGNGALHGASATLFAAGILARTRGPLLWCLKRRDLFGPALTSVGLDLSRVIFVETGDEKALLACMEEGLRHGGLCGVVGEVAKLPMIASRRLQLAAEQTGTLGLVIRRWWKMADVDDFTQPTASHSRWRITAVEAPSLPMQGVSRASGMSSCYGRALAIKQPLRWRHAMKRVISLYLPTWPTDRARRKLAYKAPPRDVPLVLVGRVKRKQILTAADQAARKLGLHVGMPLTQARASVATLVTLDADEAGDRVALRELAAWAFQHYSPIATADTDGLMIDATGVAHLFGGEQAMLQKIVERFKKDEVVARVAMATTYGAAHGLARFQRQRNIIAEDRHLIPYLAALPISALRLPDDIVHGLRMLGFETIGEIEAAPRASLALRFGSLIGLRLDQAFGRVAEPITPLIPKDVLFTERFFAEPIATPESLARVTNILVHELCAIMETQSRGARNLDLIFYRVDSQAETIRIGLAKPTRDIKQLVKLLCSRIETITSGFGIEKMALCAPWIEPLYLSQISTDLAGKASADIASLVDTLHNRLGPGHLYQIAPVESDVPERSFQRQGPLQMNKVKATQLVYPRPIRLFQKPEPIETMALLPDHPPRSFTWRGTHRRVRNADGPERVFGEWWQRDPESTAVRDYFVVEVTGGERFWLYRSGDGTHSNTGSGSWFIHGVFG